MEILLLLVLLAVFLLPTFFMTRKQNQQRRQIADMQAALSPGDRVVTAAGVHGTVVGVHETEIDLEIAPGTVATVDRMAISRLAEPTIPPSAIPGTEGTEQVDPQQNPDLNRNDGRDDNGGHPENLR